MQCEMLPCLVSWYGVRTASETCCSSQVIIIVSLNNEWYTWLSRHNCKSWQLDMGSKQSSPTTHVWSVTSLDSCMMFLLMCLIVWAITFDRFELETSFLLCSYCYIFIMSTSYSSTKVMCLRSHQQKRSWVVWKTCCYNNSNNNNNNNNNNITVERPFSRLVPNTAETGFLLYPLLHAGWN